MERARFFLLLLACLCIQYVYGVEETVENENIWYETNPRHAREAETNSPPDACKHPVFERLKKCCDVPRLMQKGTYKACKLEDGEGKMNGTARFCRSECVLRNQSLLTSDGNIDVPKLTAQFLNASDANWKPIVQAAITNCTAELKNFDVGTLPTVAPGQKMCNPKPAILMVCIHRYNLMNCPAGEKKSGATCSSEDIQALKVCDPFRFLKRILKG